jgi:protein TonB
MKRCLFFGMLLIGQYSYTQLVDPFADTSCYILDVSDPEFIGGFDSLNMFLSANLFIHSNESKEIEYPKELLTGGRVIVRFIVETDGTVSDAILISELPQCEPCNQEAIRVVMSMPKWKPSFCHEKAVRTYYYLPIKFDL